MKIGVQLVTIVRRRLQKHSVQPDIVVLEDRQVRQYVQSRLPLVLSGSIPVLIVRFVNVTQDIIVLIRRLKLHVTDFTIVQPDRLLRHYAQPDIIARPRPQKHSVQPVLIVLRVRFNQLHVPLLHLDTCGLIRGSIVIVVSVPPEIIVLLVRRARHRAQAETIAQRVHRQKHNVRREVIVRRRLQSQRVQQGTLVQRDRRVRQHVLNQ